MGKTKIEIFLEKYQVKLCRDFNEMSFEFEFETFKKSIAKIMDQNPGKEEIIKLFHHRFSAFKISYPITEGMECSHSEEMLNMAICDTTFFRYNFEEKDFEYVIKPIRQKDFFYTLVEETPEWKEKFPEESKLGLLFADKEKEKQIYREEALSTLQNLAEKTKFTDVFLEEFADLVYNEIKK